MKARTDKKTKAKGTNEIINMEEGEMIRGMRCRPQPKTAAPIIACKLG
jgi:hypothetical protein